ncbi:MAG: protein translocase subunit SecF [Alphaproteobacteria bacterium]|nr:protein translocase subunit SecF [Alphaproteobacteria bacterium]MDE2336458.1 protein translocase subunit SecF [Alphaproteobacteria bacterium]
MLRFRIVKDNTNVKFMSIHKLALFFSGAMMVTSVVLLFTRGLNFGIDFTGGLLMEIRTPMAVHIGDVRAALSKMSTGAPTIQEFGNGEVMVKIPGKEAAHVTREQISAEMKKLLDNKVDFRRAEYVGPQVGHELIMKGVDAFIYSMIGILLYIWVRFEWQFGVTGVIALAHDVCATLLFFTLTGYEFDLSTVAAVLLVAGYSINDTVVVFDRIRENLRKYRKMPLAEVFNVSVNQTLSRTMMTSMMTFLAMLALLLFGPQVIRGFTYAMLVGIIVGTYSSIFVASPILLYMNLRREPVPAKKETELAK